MFISEKLAPEVGFGESSKRARGLAADFFGVVQRWAMGTTLRPTGPV